MVSVTLATLGGLMKVTLNEHIEMVDQNSQATAKEIESLCERMRGRFRVCGFNNVWQNYKARGKHNETKRKQSRALVRQYVDMILETQDYRCTHWLYVEDDELNGVWNRPGGNYCNWRIKNIIYEIDHVHPTNAGGKDCLTNYQFLSSNANQFVKCSLTYDDLLKRVDLSDRLKERILHVLDQRQKLFASEKWQIFMDTLNKYEGTFND